MRHESTLSDAASVRATAQRAEVSLLCEVRQGFDPWRLVRLENISKSGFRIAWLPGASQSKPLRIRIPGLQMLTAQIRWLEGKAVGCEFADALHTAVFDHIVQQADSAGRTR